MQLKFNSVLSTIGLFVVHYLGFYHIILWTFSIQWFYHRKRLTTRSYIIIIDKYIDMSTRSVSSRMIVLKLYNKGRHFFYFEMRLKFVPCRRFLAPKRLNYIAWNFHLTSRIVTWKLRQVTELYIYLYLKRAYCYSRNYSSFF